MPTPVLVPRATISMDQATLVQWLKRPGDEVSEAETLFELETDKAVLEVQSPATGTLLRVETESGEVMVDQIVGWIGISGEEIPAQPDSNKPTHPEPIVPPLDEMHPDGANPLATPAAKRVARELGIDWRSATATGQRGRITQEDVERAAASKVATRKQLSAHVVNAWQTIPHIHIARRLNADALMSARASAKAASQSEISVTDLLVFSIARVVREFPALMMRPNSRTAIDISLAMETARGVVTPVICNADSLSLREISMERRRLADLARHSRLKLEDLRDGAFTLTNLGAEAVDFFAPIINSPQRAILATGRASQEAIVRNGALTVGWQLWANLAADHRFIDGAPAARFLSSLEKFFDTLTEVCGDL